MPAVKIMWIPSAKGGRKSAPPTGQYFAVAKFPNDVNWLDTAWSVAFWLRPPVKEEATMVSYGDVRFLVDDAPQERLVNFTRFEIYEGPKKVGDVMLRP